MTKRKDVDKRQGGILQRFGKWIAGEKPEDIQKAYITQRHSEVGGYSSKSGYDDTPLDGDQIVGGKHFKTVGEYKAACAKFYGPQ